MAQEHAAVVTLAQELAEVSRLVAEDDVTATLNRFVARIVRTVPGCDYATITTRGVAGMETVAGVSDAGGGPDPAALAAGPVAETLAHTEPRRLDDTEEDARWPVFSARLADAGYRSCLSLPLTTRTGQAVLTLFSRNPNQFERTGFDVVLLLTLHAGVVFDNAKLFHDSRQLVDQLRTALATRQLIGQAQGLLMHSFGCGTDQAFSRLQSASQNTNTKLRDVASSLVSAHVGGDLCAALTKFGLDPDPTAKS